MGTVNYRTGKYITLALEVPDEEYLTEEIYSQIKSVVNKYDTRQFKVTVEPGYYEGVCVLVDDYFDYFLYCDERREAQKEVTQLKHMMLELLGVGLVSTYPGWCMGYADYNGSVADINTAVKQMRSDIKAIESYADWRRRNK